MRPTFLGFEAAKTGVFVSQKALDIVGHNLSNAKTPGYTRQRIDQVSVTVGDCPTRLKIDQTWLAGMGTDAKGVAQLRDERLDTAFRQEYMNTGYYSKRADMLTDIETILQEYDVGNDGDNVNQVGNGYGLSKAIKDMYTALEDFSMDASSEADANVFANSVLNVTHLLNEFSLKLDKSSTQYKDELQVIVNDVNSMFEELADLNRSIQRAILTNGYDDPYGPNELFDQRNLILDKLAEYGSLHSEEHDDGTITVTFNGHTCVDEFEFDKINYQENSNNTVQLNWKSNGERADNETGTLKAVTEILNGRGLGATSSTESTANGFLYYQDKLDAFAVQLTTVLNSTIPDEVDESGEIISYKKLVGAAVDNEDGYSVFPDLLTTAENITITDELSNDSGYLIDKDNSTDNTRLLELINKLTKDEYEFYNGGDSFTGTFQEFVADYAGILGSDINFASGRYEASMKTVNEILDNRDSISGVSESEETVNMMTYNRAFQAAARMMTVMDGLLDVIINRMAV